MKKNIAVVGCGYWGKNLVRNFAELGALAAVCDPNEEVAQQFSSAVGVPALSFDEAISVNSVEGIVLAVPVPLHASMAIKAMTAGKHVYVEKPLAMSEEDAKAMNDCSVRKKRRLMVGHLLQYHPVFCKLKQLVEDGVIGDLRYLYSNRLSLGKLRSEEDVIWSFAPHDISMILSLVGCEPNEVSAESHVALQRNVADVGTVHLGFPGNLKAHVSVSWLHPEKEQKLVVIGSTGTLVFDDTRSWSEKLAYYSHSIEGLPLEARLSPGKKSFIQVPCAEPLKEECIHFLDVVAGNVAPRTDGEEGLRVLRVLTAASVHLNNDVSQQGKY